MLTQIHLAGRIDPLKGGAKRLKRGAKRLDTLIFGHFSYILLRLFSWARVEN
jgi:hypothetical protein